MTLYSAVGYYQAVALWLTSSSQLVSSPPVVSYNPTGNTIGLLGPHQMGLNPGSSGFSEVRFTAPGAGQYDLSGSFWGMDNSAPYTSTTAHILLNSASSLLADGTVSGFGPGSGPAFNILNVSLNQGDYLDFAVTYRGAYGYYADTGLALQITAVPEPSTFALAGLGAAALMIRRRRR